MDLAAHGYVEQEFLLRGTANLCDCDTNGWDLDRMWLTSHDEYMRDGDVHVSVTSAPNTVAALKRFDPQRYAGLSWADPRPVAQRCSGTALNSSESTDGGLVWDIVSQVGAALKSQGRNNPLGRLHVEKVYATGYSQSGSYLLRHLNAIHPMTNVYDGFLIAVAVGPRPLDKCSTAIPVDDPRNIPRPTPQPVIRVQTETDFHLDGGYSRRPDADAPDDRYRLYEVSGSAHVYAYTASFQPSPEDLQVDGAGHTVVDEHGNALGGVRTPWVDVPIATYHPSSTPDSCRLQGHRVPFTPERPAGLYPDHGYYVRAFMAQTQRLVHERWLTPADADAAINTAANSSIPR